MPSKQPALSPSCITQFETEEILKMSSNQPPKSVVLQPYVLLGKQINVVDRQIQGRLPRLLSEGFEFSLNEQYIASSSLDCEGLLLSLLSFRIFYLMRLI